MLNVIYVVLQKATSDAECMLWRFFSSSVAVGKGCAVISSVVAHRSFKECVPKSVKLVN